MEIGGQGVAQSQKGDGLIGEAKGKEVVRKIKGEQEQENVVVTDLKVELDVPLLSAHR
jgi:hypothetical protein